jgi:hypothetical protein
MFFFDSGRKLLLTFASIIFRTENIVFTIDGLDRRITKIRQIRIASGGKQLIFDDITLNRKRFFDRSSISVGAFVFKESMEKSGEDKTFINLLALVRKLRFFIKDLTIEKGSLDIGEKPLRINLSYRSEKDEDCLYCEIARGQTVNAVCKWRNEKCAEVVVSFKNIFNMNGDLLIKNPEKETTTYEFMALNDQMKIIAKGNCKNLMSDIKIDAATAEYGNIVCRCSGNIYPTKRNAVLQAKINWEQSPHFNSMPSDIIQNFKNITGYAKVDFNFVERLQYRADIVFKKFETPVGRLNCVSENYKTKIVGDIGWIKIFGLDFSDLTGEIDDEKQSKLKLSGKNFEISANIKFGDRILVEKINLTSAKGFLKSSKPFFITDNPDCSFDFDFNQLDFWNKIIPISGQGSGSFSRKNGVFCGKCEFPKLNLKNCEFHSLKIFGNEKDIQITAQNVDVFGAKLSDSNLKISDGHFNLFGKVNGSGGLKASGEIVKFFQKVSLKHCEIIFPQDKTKFEIYVADTKSSAQEVRCVLADKRKSGEAKIKIQSQETICDFKTFSVERFMKLFNRNVPDCRLDGTIKLKEENGIFTGEGALFLSNLLAHKQKLAINLNLSGKGAKIDVNFKNNKDSIDVFTFLPINLKSDGSMVRNLHANTLDCHMMANASLEKSLELPDNLDLRGNLNCDLRITGSFENPAVSGKVQLHRMYLGIGDILLRNGTISLVGNGKNIDVLRAEFVDYKGKRATISGNGALFFRGTIPDIDSNLQLKFDNFTLFDSDDLKITVKGNGSMTGSINDMIIRGDIVVPKCEIHNFASDDLLKGLDLQIENDTYLRKDKKEQDKNYFFRYDVLLRCESIKFAGSIFEMYLRGDLQLSSYQNKGTLIGELKLYGGKLDLFGKRMNFTQGNVIFLREFPFDPRALFVCKKNFRDMSVELNIKSAPEKAVSLNLHSVPSYKQDVILSKMLFEKESQYLTISEAAQLAHAVASLNRGGYVFSVLNTFQNLGVIDNISFASSDRESSSLYSNSQDTSARNNVNISAGKYIHDNVYISVNKKSEGASFDVDFAITPRISIKANTSGEAGISWKYRY